MKNFLGLLLSRMPNVLSKRALRRRSRALKKKGNKKSRASFGGRRRSPHSKSYRAAPYRGETYLAAMRTREMDSGERDRWGFLQRVNDLDPDTREKILQLTGLNLSKVLRVNDYEGLCRYNVDRRELDTTFGQLVDHSARIAVKDTTGESMYYMSINIKDVLDTIPKRLFQRENIGQTFRVQFKSGYNGSDGDNFFLLEMNGRRPGFTPGYGNGLGSFIQKAIVNGEPPAPGIQNVRVTEIAQDESQVTLEIMYEIHPTCTMIIENPKLTFDPHITVKHSVNGIVVYVTFWNSFAKSNDNFVVLQWMLETHHDMSAQSSHLGAIHQTGFDTVIERARGNDTRRNA